MRINNHKQLQADDTLRSICQDIIAQNKTDAEWAEIESDDMYQDGPYVGGYNAIEQEFWFSFFEGGKEYWFGFGLPIAEKIATGKEYWLDLIDPDKEGLR